MGGKKEDVGNLRDPCGYVSVILHHSIALRYQWDDWVKGAWDLSAIS